MSQMSFSDFPLQYNNIYQLWAKNAHWDELGIPFDFNLYINRSSAKFMFFDIKSEIKDMSPTIPNIYSRGKSSDNIESPKHYRKFPHWCAFMSNF